MGIQSFKLSKFLIAVMGMIVFSFAFSINLPSQALAEPVAANSDADERMFKLHIEECEKPGNEKLKKSYDDSCSSYAAAKLGISKGGTASATNACDEARKAFNTANDDFIQSCGASDETCLNTAFTCSTCQGRNPPSYCPGVAETSKERKARFDAMIAGKTSSKDRATELSKMRSCPSVAYKRVEELKDEVEEHKKQKKEYEDDLNEVVEELQTAEAELKESYGEHQAKLEELNTALEEAEKKIKGDTKDEQKEKRKQYDDLNTQISQFTFDLQKINLQKIEAIAEAERACHNQALGQLDVFLKDRRAALNASQLSSGSLKKLFTSTGSTRGQKNASFAMKYYTSCLQMPTHTDKINSIKNVHALQVQQINKSITSARNQQLTLIKEIAGEETQAKFKEQIEGIYKQHNRDTQKEISRFDSDVQKRNASIESLKRKKAMLTQRLEEESLELTDKIAVYGVADEITGGGGKDDAGAKFIVNYGSARATAGIYIGECGCTDKFESDGNCKKAQKVYCAQYKGTNAEGEDGGYCDGVASRETNLKKDALDSRRQRR